MIRCLLLTLLSLSLSVLSMILWVDKSHGSASDATTRASNTASSPWLTLGRAVWGTATRTSPDTGQCAQPGDTVIVKDSATPYTTAQWLDDDTSCTYNPARSGTVGNPITFKAETVGGVRLAWSVPASGKGCMIGATNLREYIVWRGFVIDEAEAHPSGWPVNFSDGRNSTAEYITVLGDRTNTADLDNHAGFRLERSRGITISNCRASDIINTTAGGSQNGCGVELYTSSDYLIENGEFFDNGTGIFIKAPYDEDELDAYLGSGIIRTSICRDNSDTNLTVHRSPLLDPDRLLVYQNILIGGDETGFILMSFGDGSTGPRNCSFFNNLIYHPGIDAFATGNGSVWAANAGNEFKNNLVVLASSSNPLVSSAMLDAQFTAAKLSVNRNGYNGHGSTFFAGGSGNKNFAGWQGLGSSSYDTNGSTATITFVNAGAEDFRLATNGQAALTLGRVIHWVGGTNGDTIPAGPYITGTETIGVEAEDAEPSVAILTGGRAGGYL